MAGPILYSTNPWVSYDIATRYRGKKYFAWVSEYFDAAKAPPRSAGAAIAPSSNPKQIYENLSKDVDGEDTHSFLIKGYKKKFKALATKWLADGTVTTSHRDEIISMVQSNSWKIWRPVLYVIPKQLIDPGRIVSVPHKLRAAYGPEMQIMDLDESEFDVIELTK